MMSLTPELDGRVHQQGLVIADAQHTANVHDQHDHDRRHDRGDRHVEDLLQAGRAVHLGGFMHRSLLMPVMAAR